MDIHSVRQQLKTRSIYDLPLRVTYYARVSTEKDEQIHSLQRDDGLTGMPDAETFAQSPGFHSGCGGHGVYLLF